MTHQKDQTTEMTGPLPPPEKKAAYVQEMFSRISGRYDLMNRVMSLGRDKSWRRYTVTQALASALLEGRMVNARILDVATGTGDLAFEVLRQQPEAQVVGLDFVPEMLALAAQKASSRRQLAPQETQNWRVSWSAGDALKLPFPDASFDAVVTGFAMRNVTDIPAAFAEIARVTRPGGRVACLEIAKPKTPLFRQFFRLYFYRLVPIMGGLITGQSSAYVYLPNSLTAFLTPDEIVDVLYRVGWQNARYRRLMLGTIAVHVAERA